MGAEDAIVPDACLKRLTERRHVTAGCSGLEAAVPGFAVPAQAAAGIAWVRAVGRPSGGPGIS